MVETTIITNRKKMVHNIYLKKEGNFFHNFGRLIKSNFKKVAI